MTTLYLIRGLPGSGKSTFAAKNFLVHYEADSFFVDPHTGGYEFDYRFLHYAHQRCLAATARALKFNIAGDVAVANTFTRSWELKAYVDLARLTGSEVLLIHCTGKFQSVHGVPEEKILEMEDRFESNEKVIIALKKGYPDVKILGSTYDGVLQSEPQAYYPEAKREVP